MAWFSGKTEKTKFFVFDSETSGLSPKQDRIVELAVLEFVPGQEASEMEPLSMLVNPERNLTRENMKIHGISNAMLKDAPLFPEAWDLFVAYVESACADNERPVLVAHNAIFEVNFLRNELHRAGLPFPDWDVSCTLKLARKMWPGQPAKLANLTAKFNVTDYAEHRAGGDVQALCLVLDNINGIVMGTGKSVEDSLLKHARRFEYYGNRGATAQWVQPSLPKYFGSPRSAFSTASDRDSSVEKANYYRALTGARYHVRSDCYGLRNAKVKIPCNTIPSGLTPCNVCAGG